MTLGLLKDLLRVLGLEFPSIVNFSRRFFADGVLDRLNYNRYHVSRREVHDDSRGRGAIPNRTVGERRPNDVTFQCKWLVRVEN